MNNLWPDIGMSDFILVQNRPLSGAQNSVGPKGQSNNVEMRESVREINNENREFMTAASTGITVSSFNKQRGKKKSAFIDQRSAMNKKHQKSRNLIQLHLYSTLFLLHAHFVLKQYF